VSINRVPSVPFAQIANEALRDRRLTYKARGLLAMVLSNVGEWQATAEWLEQQSINDGRHAIQTALNELTEHGYRRVRRERLDSGQIATIVDWFHEPLISRPTENPTVGLSDGRETGGSIEHHPLEHHHLEHHHSEQGREKQVGLPEGRSEQDRLGEARGEQSHSGAERSQQPASAQPRYEHDPSGEHAPEATISTRTRVRKPIIVGDDPAFDEFWAIYPRKASKARARIAWAKAQRHASPEAIIAGAERYRDDPNREDAYTAHATTWLNGERWDDPPLPSRHNRSERKSSEVMDVIMRAAQRDELHERGVIEG
jgi:hypothetical protein